MRQVCVQFLIEYFDFSDPHNAPIISASLKIAFFVVFVFNVANDLFKHVFHCHQARGATVFVDNDRQMVAAAAKIVQEQVKTFCFRNEYSGVLLIVTWDYVVPGEARHREGWFLALSIVTGCKEF